MAEHGIELEMSLLPPGTVNVHSLVMGLNPGVLIEFGKTETESMKIDVTGFGGPKSAAEIAEVLEMVADLARTLADGQ